MPTPEQLLAHVHASAELLGLPLDAARAQRVAEHLGRTAAMAQLLETAALLPHDEPAEIYCPAPFPEIPGGVGSP